ncbi:MAG: 5-bromo-4-chloroindolyl phosphate hydrolysis family protein [Lachnospiraceae bacterium]|nr:5-bromo-4-chloroindolyl phosphate hydrolysis family protein [Lachnospiraceae bacterium]
MASDNNRSRKNNFRNSEEFFSSTGQEMLDAVTRAVQEGNYTGLAESLSDQINSALNGAQRGLSGRMAQRAWEVYRNKQRSQGYNSWNGQSYGSNGQSYQQGGQADQQYNNQANNQHYNQTNYQAYGQTQSNGQNYNQTAGQGWTNYRQTTGTSYRQTNGQSYSQSNAQTYSQAQSSSQPYNQSYTQAQANRRNFNQSYGAYGNPSSQGAPSYFLARRVSNGFGNQKRILGTIGEIVFGFLAFCFGVGMVAYISLNDIAALIVAIAFLIGNLYIFSRFKKLKTDGQHYNDLVSEYHRYGNAIGNREYFLIKDLAQWMHEDPYQTMQNLVDMKKYDMLPQASFDVHYTTLLLTDRARMLYQNALNAERQRKSQNGQNPGNEDQVYENMEQASQSSAKSGDRTGHNAAWDGNTSAPLSDLQKILNDGDRYLKKIRAANDEIPDTEAMSDKLYRLENITRSIFAAVKKDPDKAKDLRRIMSYYLPTTEKLLDAYLEFYRNPAQSDQKKQSMAEIEQAIDAVCDGFERFLAKMTEPDMMDISSDITVMKHMMEQDGMTDSDMKAKS